MKINKIKFECSPKSTPGRHFEFEASSLESLYSSFLKQGIINGDPDMISHKFTREALWILIHKDIDARYNQNWYVWDNSQNKYLNLKEVLAFDWNDMIFLKR